MSAIVADSALANRLSPEERFTRIFPGTDPLIHQANGCLIRFAQSPEDIRAAQRLRYEVFYEQGGAKPSADMASQRLDFDRFDDHALHVLLFHTEDGRDELAGTLRLTINTLLPPGQGFYTEQFYDCSAMKLHEGLKVEIGRLCIAAPHRSKPYLGNLWRYALKRIVARRFDLLFGCASFPGADPDLHKHTLSYIYHNAREKNHALSGLVATWPDRTPMAILPPEALDTARALEGIPTLLRGYLRVGAITADEAIIDRQFNTVFTAIFVNVRALDLKFD